MKKFYLVILILILFLLFNLCFSIPKPKQDTGSIIGKTYIELDKDWQSMRAGKYYKVQVNIVSKDTGKKYSIFANKDGIFYFFNLQPGEYIITHTRYKYQTATTIFTINGYFGKEGITVNVNSNKITAVKTIGVKKEVLPFDESRDKVSTLQSWQRMNQSIVREDNMLELKTFFKEIDKRNQWDNIEWE